MNNTIKAAIAATAFSSVVASFGIGGVIAAHAGIESTHEVPKWMTKVCPTEDSVNCWYEGGQHGNTGPYFVREFPGKAHEVCVMFVDKPRKDYCIKNTPRYSHN